MSKTVRRWSIIPCASRAEAAEDAAATTADEALDEDNGVIDGESFRADCSISASRSSRSKSFCLEIHAGRLRSRMCLSPLVLIAALVLFAFGFIQISISLLKKHPPTIKKQEMLQAKAHILLVDGEVKSTSQFSFLSFSGIRDLAPKRFAILNGSLLELVKVGASTPSSWFIDQMVRSG
jgi:hypothetical protein